MKNGDNKCLSIFLSSAICISTFLGMTSQVSAGEVDFAKISFEEGDNNYIVEASSNPQSGIVEIEYVSENATDGNTAIKATYGAGQWPGVSFQPADKDNYWDLSDTSTSIAIDVFNPSNTVVTLNVKFDIKERGNGLVMEAKVPKGKSTLFLSNATFGGNVELGFQNLPPTVGENQGVKIGWYENQNAYDSSKINQFSLWMTNHKPDTVLYYDNIRIEPNPFSSYEIAYADLVDKYGQYTANDWENKVTSDEQLLASEEAEQKLLEEMIASNPTDRTIYGGWKNEDLKQEATGRFEVAKIGEQWTFIDPLGYPYFATGVDIMRLADMNTWVSLREFMFEELPSKTGDFAEHYQPVEGTARPPFGQDSVSDGTYNFYSANLERKYGDDWKELWSTNALKRFEAWGMTSLGCWADPELYYGMDEKSYEYKIPYAAHAWAHEDESDEEYNYINVSFRTIADPFDPYFETSLRTAIQNTADAGVAEDPYCMGIYVDNEIGWGSQFSGGGNDHYAAVTGAFAVDSSTLDAKVAFIEMMKEKYGTIDKLNDAWKSKFASFDDMNAPYKGNIAIKDKSEMLYALADKYYSTVDKLLNEIMPDVLYLGSRLAEWGTSDEIAKACAEYVDVLSYNCYYRNINQRFINTSLDIPLIIGEFHFTANDRGFFEPGLVPTPTVERGNAYETYAKSALTQGDFVGVHWFQYYDQPVSGRAWDGENNNTGFVDVTDQPYEHLVDSARKVNNEMYKIKFDEVTDGEPETNEIETDKPEVNEPDTDDVVVDNVEDESFNSLVIALSVVGVVVILAIITFLCKKRKKSAK